MNLTSFIEETTPDIQIVNINDMYHVYRDGEVLHTERSLEAAKDYYHGYTGKLWSEEKSK